MRSVISWKLLGGLSAKPARNSAPKPLRAKLHSPDVEADHCQDRHGCANDDDEVDCQVVRDLVKFEGLRLRVSGCKIFGRMFGVQGLGFRGWSSGSRVNALGCLGSVVWGCYSRR